MAKLLADWPWRVLPSRVSPMHQSCHLISASTTRSEVHIVHESTWLHTQLWRDYIVMDAGMLTRWPKLLKLIPVILFRRYEHDLHTKASEHPRASRKTTLANVPSTCCNVLCMIRKNLKYQQNRTWIPEVSRLDTPGSLLITPANSPVSASQNILKRVICVCVGATV